ncbi:hypothetical protein [Pasteurella multocida]|uniref:hypothetical protein n=1 Tax=Pasteurella multocida TaxID=747 RepID=UPI0023010CE5|nr:hypothetical protein [Pasteurella multocida]MDA5607039.1 hypothetical protein [Pasteurella multocida subsp. multocida]MDA5614698.1 hypothetical protein [Pasteurella multocida]MDA5624579.1 hypothetical protein [Pasteurella multocida]
MRGYTATLQLIVEANNEDLNIKTGVDYQNSFFMLSEIMSDLLIKMPILIRAGWNTIINQYPEVENGFVVFLTFHFEKEDDDWTVTAKSANPKTVEDMLLGMTKLIFDGDPIIEKIINHELESLNLPESVQHFDPTC